MEAQTTPMPALTRAWAEYSRESANVVRQGPSVASYLAIGRSWHKWGSYEEAIASFNAALEIAPLDKDVWLNIGKTVARRRAGGVAHLAGRRAALASSTARTNFTPSNASTHCL